MAGLTDVVTDMLVVLGTRLPAPALGLPDANVTLERVAKKTIRLRGETMSKQIFRAAVATAAAASMIAVGTGVATAEPVPQPVSVVTEIGTAGLVQPAALSFFVGPPGAVLVCLPLLAVPIAGILAFPVCVA